MTAVILAATRARWAATITHDAPAAAQLWHQLEERLTGGHGATGQRGIPGPRYPNFQAIHARTLIRETLTYWCHLIAEKWQVNLPGHWTIDDLPPGFIGPPNLAWHVVEDVTTMGNYIARYAVRLADTDYAGACADEIHEVATGWAWRVCYPTGTRIVPIGRCPQDGCSGVVRAILRPAEATLDSELACDTCRCTWPMERWAAYARNAA